MAEQLAKPLSEEEIQKLEQEFIESFNQIPDQDFEMIQLELIPDDAFFRA